MKYSLNDLYDMTPKSFLNAQKGMWEMWEHETQGAWERARWMSAAIINPHVKKNIKPTDLCDFPWERKFKRTKKAVSKIEAEAMLYKKISDKNMKDNGG